MKKDTLRNAALLVSLTVMLLSLPRFATAQPHRTGMIGLGLTDVPGIAGAVVGIVAPGGPAERAGVQPRDVVTTLNGIRIENSSALTTGIRAMAPGQVAHLGILRGGASAAQPLEIAVVLRAANDVAPPSLGQDTHESPPTGAASGSTLAYAPALTAPRENGQVRPLAVSGYTTFTDPLEDAFTIEVPSGWRTVGGLARRSALEINAFVRSLSPDKLTYLLIGEPTLLSYVPPNQMRNTLGYREGKLFDSGLGGISQVLHYMPGTEFARLYGQTALAGLCSSLEFSGTRERADMAQNADKLVPAVAPSISTGGEARFSCRHNGQQTEARVEAVTRMTRDNIMWNVIFLKGFLAPASQADAADELLAHVGGSFQFNPTWLQRQSNLDQQAAMDINRRMQEFFRQQAGVIQKLNSVDETFSSMDEIVSGYSTYHDAATGNDYKLSNTNPFKWTDNTGRIFSTPTDVPPAWGGNLTPLTHLSQ